MRKLFTVASAFLALGSLGARLDAQGAQTVCKDGTTTATSGRGACSGHGGVDTKATAAAEKAAKAAAKTEKKTATKETAQVTCSDGTLSKPGRGACSGHGGIKTSAVATAAPSLPAAVPATAPARTKSEAKSKAPTATKEASKRGEDNDPRDAIAQCKDGMYSHASNRQGACSRHGGVSKWMKQP